MATPNRKGHSFLVNFVVFVWRALTWLRGAILNVLLLLILVIIAVAIFKPKQPVLPDKAPLLLSPSGILVDQYSYTSPRAQLLSLEGDGNPETLVREVINTIDHAARDERISGLLLHLDDLRGGGVSKMQEIGRAIERFRAAGKPVIALADNYDQQQYFLASYADEIYLHDLGGVGLIGFGLYRNYFKDALDKLSVRFHVFKVGQFKDFVEPFISNDMSEASREHNRQWLAALWQTYTDQVEQRRGLEAGSLTGFINDMAAHLAATRGDTAQLALQHKLVDHVGSRQARNRALIERFGAMTDEPETVLHITAADYNQQRQWNTVLEDGNVALIVATGTILDGEHPEGTIGGDTLSQLIRKARQDDQIKALVLRVDSGGGSAFASEIIRQELEHTREAGIPVVISMGSVAASGGYWIAMAADEIWATPTTITGSIGVFGLLPALGEGLDKLGIHTDGIGTTELAPSLRPDLPLPSEAAQVMQLGVEHIYSTFLQLVATNRGSEPEQIDEIAQGRVWTGLAAETLGLVDKVGYLEDAVAAAAQKAGLDNYKVKLIERDLSPQEQLLRELIGSPSARRLARTGLAQWLGFDSSVLSVLGELAKTQHSLLQVGRAGTYAWCAECLAP